MRNVNLAAAAIIVCGAALLARPKPVSATYINPWGASGITYCCQSTGGTGESSCCGMRGCATTGGICFIFQ